MADSVTEELAAPFEFPPVKLLSGGVLVVLASAVAVGGGVVGELVVPVLAMFGLCLACMGFAEGVTPGDDDAVLDLDNGRVTRSQVLTIAFVFGLVLFSGFVSTDVTFGTKSLGDVAKSAGVWMVVRTAIRAAKGG